MSSLVQVDRNLILSDLTNFEWCRARELYVVQLQECK